jgi:hypothetical protein
MRFSCFSRFGHYRFSGKRPAAQAIFYGLRDALGGTENLGDHHLTGPMAGSLFAKAFATANAQRAVDQFTREQTPHTSEHYLEMHERDYLIVPPASATRDERRSALLAAELLSLGCNDSALQDALSTLLGSALVAVRTHDSTEFVIAPADWATTGPGTWKPASIIAKWHRLTAAIGAPGLQSFSSTSIHDDATVLTGGDVIVIDPGKFGIQEKVTITSTGQGTFVRAHEVGALVTTEPFPFATTSSRHILIVTTTAVATSTAWRRRVAVVMNKLARAVDCWSLVDETVAGTLGPFYPDVVGVSPGIPGVTPLISIPTVP